MNNEIMDLNDLKIDSYGIAGIVQFLKNQSMKNEIIRAQWNVEKAELQARIAFLQGERKGQENLKVDLVKRIKMLEYSLEQENNKLNFIKSQKSMITDSNVEENIDLSEISIKSPKESSGRKSPDKAQKFSLKEIRQFIVDNGYRDIMAEVRESRVKQLLGLSPEMMVNSIDCLDKDNGAASNKSVNVIQQLERNFPTQIDISTDLNFRSDNYKFENFDNKTNENYDDSPIYDTVDDSSTFDERYIGVSVTNVGKNHNDYPVSVENLPHPEIMVSGDSSSALGELASLTILNEAVDAETNLENIDTSTQKHNNRISWSPKFSLRSHFDSIRCVGFHETKPLLITGSEDKCLKLWNLVKTYHSKKSSNNFEMEPIYTFRGHKSPVLSMVINDETIFSGDLDGDVKLWNIPSKVELYDEYNSSVLSNATLKHPNAVWSLTLQKASNKLLSGSADGMINLWDINALSDKPLKKIALSSSSISSMSFVTMKPDNCVVGTGKGEVFIINLETGQTICSLATGDTAYWIKRPCQGSFNLLTVSRTWLTYSGLLSTYQVWCPNSQPNPEEEMSTVYKLIVHPTKSLIISGNDDRKIRMFDINSGKLVSSLVAHLDAVSSVAIEHKSGANYLLSGSHDCSIRLWDLSTHACIQETTSHRKKFDESINDISVHPNLQYFASGGSDAIAKVFI